MLRLVALNMNKPPEPTKFARQRTGLNGHGEPPDILDNKSAENLDAVGVQPWRQWRGWADQSDAVPS